MTREDIVKRAEILYAFSPGSFEIAWKYAPRWGDTAKTERRLRTILLEFYRIKKKPIMSWEEAEKLLWSFNS